MSAHRTSRFIGVITLAAVVVAIVLEVSFAVARPGVLDWYRVVSFHYQVIPVVAFGLVGHAIVGNRPRHPVGWLFIATSVAVAVGMLAGGWTAWPLIGADWLVLAERALGAASFPMIALALLLFPTGAPPPGWRWLLRLGVTLLGLLLVVSALLPWEAAVPPNELDFIANPIGLGTPSDDLDPAGLGFTIGVLLILGASLALRSRWRRADLEERLQVKWLGMAGILIVVIIGLSALVDPLNQADPDSAVPFVLGDLVFNAAVLTLPVSMGLGILRFRLYDVDRLVSRTLTYVLVVGVMTAIYASVTVGIAALSGSMTGGAGGELGVAASTLAAASLFRPTLTRVRAVVDRRFNRRRTEALARVDGFREAVRDAVDVVTISGDVADAAAEAFEPTMVSVWLAPTASRADRTRARLKT